MVECESIEPARLIRTGQVPGRLFGQGEVRLGMGAPDLRLPALAGELVEREPPDRLEQSKADSCRTGGNVTSDEAPVHHGIVGVAAVTGKGEEDGLLRPG